MYWKNSTIQQQYVISLMSAFKKWQSMESHSYQPITAHFSDFSGRVGPFPLVHVYCVRFSLCVFVRECARSLEPNSKVIEAGLIKIYLPTMLNLAFGHPPPTHPTPTYLFICGNLHSGREHVKVSLGLIFTDFVPNCSTLWKLIAF